MRYVALEKNVKKLVSQVVRNYFHQMVFKMVL